MIKRKAVAAAFLASAMCVALVPGGALAGNGNGNGNSGSHGNSGTHGKSGQQGKSSGQTAIVRGKSGDAHGKKDALSSAIGKIASELKWMNSGHANQSARDNAAPNSRPGMDGSYLDAALATKGAYDALYEADPDLAESADITTLEEAKALYENETDPDAKANDKLLVDYLAAQETEAEKLDTVSGGRTLSDTALSAYRDMLGL